MAETTTVRVTVATKTILDELAAEEQTSVQGMLAKLVEEERRRRIIEQTHQVYDALRSDPQSAQAWDEEQRLWEATLGDGLENL
jgi:hypothetical protein